jgi:hypothetical protein
MCRLVALGDVSEPLREKVWGCTVASATLFPYCPTKMLTFVN